MYDIDDEHPFSKNIKKFLKDGKTSYEMAEALGVSQAHIIRSLKKFGIKLKRPSNAKECMQCGKIFNRTAGKYCSSKCQSLFESKKCIENWLNGKLAGYSGKTKQLKRFVRNYILQRDNFTCTQCGWNKIHPIDKKPLVEVDHIDGDAENCMPENLKTLCPNCHAMTPTYKARNKNSKRNRKPD